MANKLCLIQPEQVQSNWSLVRPGIEAVQRHSVSHWVPEDVYTALRTGHSNLHIGYVGAEYAGFAVTTTSATWDGKTLHFWCVYNAGKHDVLALFDSDFVAIAHGLGVKRMTFWSPRAGWSRRLESYGFKPMQVEYVREL